MGFGVLSFGKEMVWRKKEVCNWQPECWTVTETAMCSPNLLPFPPVDTVGLHFPAALVVGHGHMTEFWSMEYVRRDVPTS